MDIPMCGASLGKSLSQLRAFILIATGLCSGVGGAALPAMADDGPIYVAPGPSNLLAPQAVRPNQEQLAGTARKLGDLIGDSLRSPTSHATELVVTTKCGHYQFASISYADGTAKTLNLGNAPASQSDMVKAKAAIPILRIIDQPGCDH
jgi:hypothetical protein